MRLCRSAVRRALALVPLERVRAFASQAAGARQIGQRVIPESGPRAIVRPARPADLRAPGMVAESSNAVMETATRPTHRPVPAGLEVGASSGARAGAGSR